MEKETGKRGGGRKGGDKSDESKFGLN